MPRYLTPDEVGDLLRVSPRTLAGWRTRKGGPPFVRVSGVVVRYPEDRLHEWMEARIVELEPFTVMCEGRLEPVR